MFSLLSGMWLYFFGIPQYNVLVLGLDNAGKSTFLYQVGNICDRKKKQNANKKKKDSPKPQKSKPKLKRKSSDNANDDDNNTLNTLNTLNMDNNNNSENENDAENDSLYRLDPKLRQIIPTMGQNVKIMEFDNMTLQFWDLPGQTNFRKIWTHYYSEVHAIVFMVDSADNNRLNEAKYELHKLLHEYELKYAPILVLANKQDLKQAIDYQSIINTLQIMGSSSSISSDDIKQNNDDNKHQQNNNNNNNNDNKLSPIDEHKQSFYNQLNKGNNNNDGFKDRSIKVMCSCCLNKDGLSDAISWLVYIIPLAKKRLQYVSQFHTKQMEQKKQ